MVRTMPHVEQGTLTVGLPGVEELLRVGEPAWFSWLETATAFTFACPDGMFTARRERASSGRGGWYWRAYQRRAGKLRRAYLGKAAELTLERLQTVAAHLADAGVAEQAPNRAEAGGDGPLAVSREPQALPSGTVTFLFTDIVGSTQLWEQHHEAMGTALARHDTLLRQAIGAQGGVVFKTVGHSVHAVFARAPDALAAALDAQRALQQERWDSTGPLRVRMALHSGAAEPREGDYFGGPLNRLARILGLGHGGQILLSRATHDLLADELPAQTSLRALGDYHLKDLARPEPIFQCVSADLPADFLPLRSDNLGPGAGVPTPQLLATKLYLPRVRPDLVARPRLFARLDAGLLGALTLVCAPAGFGKTTLLAEWLRRTRRPAAWLGLDAGDSDPALFLRYLVAALQALAPEVGATLLGLLQSPQPPPLETLLTVLVNDLARVPHECILVLDDYHVLAGPPVHQAVSFLLDHLPPELHLIIATREDPPLPLARLRARRQVAELRADQLRFTTDEAAVFLTEVMGLRLSPTDVAALETRTEGWIAGLQFAALAMQDRDDHAGFISAFTGSNRFVVDYLADEVLRRQPSHIQTFLLQTSILDRMCGSLCDAILGVTTDHRRSTTDAADKETGRQGDKELPPFSSSQSSSLQGSVSEGLSVVGRRSSVVGEAYSQLLLEQLERANLFVTPLDDERRWYRYHHLFGEVLRERLRRGTNVATVANLHGRASAWYQQHGMIDEAVQHALAAGAVVDAARLIEQHGLMLIVQGHRSRVLTWMEALPDAVIRAHPDLCIVHVAALVLVNQLAAAEARLHDAENAIRADMPTEAAQIIRGRVAQGYADLARYRGDLVRYITLSRQVLEIVPESDALGRAAAMMHLSRAYLVTGHITSEMEQQAVAVIEPARASGNVLAWLIALLNLAQVRALRGRLQQAAATYQAALTVAPNLDAFRHLYGSAAYYVGMGDIFREWNDLDSAEQHLAQSRELAVGEQLVDPDVILRGYSALARLRMAQGDDAGALDAIDEFLDLAHQRAFFPGLSRQALAVQTRIRLGQGNLAAATAWADSCGLQVDDATNYLREFEYLTLVRVRIAQRRSDGRAGDLDDALRILDQLSAAAEMSERLGSLVEIVLLRALVFDSQGDSDAALRELERVLNLAKPEGYVRVFVDEGVSMAALLRAAAQQGIASSYVASLLAAFPEGPGARDLRLADAPPASSLKPQASRLVEPLTARELEVLRLLADGASNGQIAQRLIVSLGTVKKHIANIFGKLEAQNRTQAVARARALDLL